MTAAIMLFERSDRLRDKGKDTPELAEQITAATAAACDANTLYEQVNILCTWLQYDVLQHASFNPEDRDHLYNFIVEELAFLRDQHSQIDSFVRSLIFQKERLLSVSHTLNSHFEIIANEQDISISDVWQICYFTRFEIQADRYHFYAQSLADKLGELDYDKIEDKVIEAMAKTPRCSSMIENFNSRLRRPQPQSGTALAQNMASSKDSWDILKPLNLKVPRLKLDASISSLKKLTEIKI